MRSPTHTPTPIDRERVRELVRGGAQLVEVLPADEYDDAHLPGALNIPLKELDATSASRLRRDRPVITYCNDFQ
jgi:rhodanese-related sulfurtransferase